MSLNFIYCKINEIKDNIKLNICIVLLTTNKISIGRNINEISSLKKNQNSVYKSWPLKKKLMRVWVKKKTKLNSIIVEFG